MNKKCGFFKKSNGSALAMVLFLVFVLSATALAVMALTGSELVMSTVTSDRSKALFAAQAGAEKVAQRLDIEVGRIQDNARVTSSAVIKKAIDEKSSVFNEIIDTTDPANIKVLEEKKLNDIYEEEYKYQFFKMLQEWLEQQTATGGDWNSSVSHNVQHDVTKEGKNVSINDGSFNYSVIHPNQTEETYSSIEDSATLEANEISSITVKSTGEYKSGKHAYKRSISAEFSLLTESVNNNDEIPIIYNKLTRVKVNKDKKPEILKDKAVVARKNIISVNGTVNIENGNVVCFGTIPTVNGTDINYNADGYKYGGFMAGMTNDTWNDINLGNDNDNKSIKESIEKTPGMSYSNFTNSPGAFNIQEGNAITAAYVHTLYSNANSPSRINIQKGDVYARCVKLENKAHSSEVNLKNVFLTDDLRIDSNNSTVNIGKWDDKDREGMLVGLNPGDPASGYDTSSAVIVSGDSNLNINGSLYIGGTTYFNEYTNITDNKMYFSGISVLKSGSLPAEAFRMWDDIEVPSTDGYTRNVFYLYDQIGGYKNINDHTEEDKLTSAAYNYKPKIGSQSSDPTTVQMMMGSQKKPLFNIIDRAMHFKWIWENSWKDDVGYYSYLNSGDIRIEYYEKAADGNYVKNTDKVKGWCYGAVAANDMVYGPYDGFVGGPMIIQLKKARSLEIMQTT